MSQTKLSWSAPIPKDDRRPLLIGASAGLLCFALVAGLVLLVVGG